MDLHINRLADLVAVELGEYPDPATAGWTIHEGCSLRDMVEIILEPLARETVMELPLSDCTFLRDLKTCIHTRTDWGDGPPFTCELPTDFLRLHSLRMKDWPHTLSEEYRGDNVRLALGGAAPDWLAQRLSRPMIEIRTATDTLPAILQFSNTTVSEAAEAVYIPDVCYDSDEGVLRNFQPLALPRLVGKITSRLKSI